LECPNIQYIDTKREGTIPRNHPLIATLETSYIKQAVLPAPKKEYAADLEVWTDKKSTVEYNEDFYVKDET